MKPKLKENREPNSSQPNSWKWKKNQLKKRPKKIIFKQTKKSYLCLRNWFNLIQSQMYFIKS
jgi:hypothetical protein